jgi:hypothetical protein
MESHIVSLAEAYAQHWIHRMLRVNEMSRFLVVESAAPPVEFTSDDFTAFSADLYVDRAVWYPRAQPVSTEPEHVYGFEAKQYSVFGAYARHGSGSWYIRVETGLFNQIIGS